MRVYIIGNDGITLCRTAPAAVNNGEIAVASNEELHAAPLSAKRLLALWNAAGYSARTSAEIGRQNLRKLEIAAAIEKAIAGRAERAELTGGAGDRPPELDKT